METVNDKTSLTLRRGDLDRIICAMCHYTAIQGKNSPEYEAAAELYKRLEHKLQHTRRFARRSV